MSDWSTQQSRLIDIVDACSWRNTPPDSMTTKQVAELAGLPVEEVWRDLHAADYLHMFTPDDVSFFDDIEDMSDNQRARCVWSCPEDNHATDEEWYAHRIAAATSVGDAESVSHWTNERESSRERGTGVL